MATIEKLLENLALYGGKIVNTADLSADDIQQAQAGERMYVDENSLGFVWVPKIDKFPETIDEVERFEKWYPLEVGLPDELKNPPFLNSKWENKLPGEY